MPILRKREQLLPVTCAVLNEDQRTRFFSAVRRRAGGRDDRIAKKCGFPSSLLGGWASGKTNIPFLTLQRLATEFNVDMPVVSELRRELQEVVEMKSTSTAGGAAPERKSERGPSRKAKTKKKSSEPDRDRPSRPVPDKPSRPERDRKAESARSGAGGRKKKKKTQKRAKKTAAPAAQGPTVPKLSDEAAYWTGVVLSAARWSGGVITLSADKRMGQNFADTWAQMTKKLFGIRPAVNRDEETHVQSATLPEAGLEGFLDKTGLRRDAEPSGAPRWAWSNPEWKKAFLKGLMDTAAEFERSPALRMRGLKEELRKAAKKMLGGIGFEAVEEEGGILAISGRDTLARYIEEVGTGNLKLRDQIRAYLSRGGGDQGSGVKKAGGRRRRRGGRRKKS